MSQMYFFIKMFIFLCVNYWEIHRDLDNILYEDARKEEKKKEHDYFLS